MNKALKNLKIIILLFLTFFGSHIFAQTKSTVSQSDTVKNIHLKVYANAKILGDVNTAIYSLNYLIASDQIKFAMYADTLAEAYLNAGYYVQCNNLSSILLQQKPSNEFLMSLKATSLKQLNQAAIAADLYDQLYKKTEKIVYGIELMQLQLSLQRLPECLQTTVKALSQDIKDTEKISVVTADGKSTQQVMTKAFIYYVQGLAYNTAKEKEKAIIAVEKAIEVDKNFELALSAIKVLKTPSVDSSKDKGVKK